VLAVAATLMLGGCASGPTAAEKSACALAATQGAPSTLTLPPKPITIDLIDPATIRATESSSDPALAAAAHRWMVALGLGTRPPTVRRRP
jgi:hypothetical protein